MRCGAYRALLELKTLWPHAVGTPENPRGGIELKILRILNAIAKGPGNKPFINSKSAL